MRHSLFIIFVVSFIASSCKSPSLDNPSHLGDKSYWQSEFLRCLITQSNSCPGFLSIATPTAPTVEASNTFNTITWSNVNGATAYYLIFGTNSGLTKTNGNIISSVVSPYTHTGLTNNSTYYYAVVAKNGNSESEISKEISATPICSPCKMFVSSSTFDGAMIRSDAVAGTGASGITKADSWCQSDPNRPTSPSASVYKALLAETSSRIACTSANCLTSGNAEHINWILKASMRYVRLDGVTDITTTNSFGIFSSQVDIMATNVTPIWVYSTGGWSGAGASQTCSNWSGVSNGCQSNSANYFAGGCGQACTANYKAIVCVEQ